MNLFFDGTHVLTLLLVIVDFSKPREWPIPIHLRSCKGTSQGNTWNGTFSTCVLYKQFILSVQHCFSLSFAQTVPFFPSIKGHTILMTNAESSPVWFNTSVLRAFIVCPLCVDPISRPGGLRAVNKKSVQCFGEHFLAPHMSFVKSTKDALVTIGFSLTHSFSHSFPIYRSRYPHNRYWHVQPYYFSIYIVHHDNAASQSLSWLCRTKRQISTPLYCGLWIIWKKH